MSRCDFLFPLMMYKRFLLIDLLSRSQKSSRQNSFLSLLTIHHLHRSINNRFISYNLVFWSIVMLNVNPRQNMTLDHDSSHYTEVLQSMIEWLKFSPLVQALTIAEFVPLVHLSKVYSSAFYSQQDGVIHFEVATHKSSISKSRFCRLLGFTSTEGFVDPDSISSNVRLQWGYISHIQVQEAQYSSNVEQVIQSLVQEPVWKGCWVWQCKQAIFHFNLWSLHQHQQGLRFHSPGTTDIEHNHYFSPFRGRICSLMVSDR